MREKKWIYRCAGIKKEMLAAMSKELKISPVIITLLLNRGIKTYEDMKAYMTKSMRTVRNPMGLPGMEAAVERILSAVEKQEKIVIYGDYDVDGITSTALLYDFLKGTGANVSYYIPDRMEEGYGINIMAVNKLIKQGTKLLITVDCGITAVGEVEFAKLQGMDVVITDHHTCKEKIPAAAAVVNPKLPDSEYGFEGLAGVGVAFKLVLALTMEMKGNTREIFDRYAELAAIGTIADVVPLVDENRVIADKGLAILDKTRREGLKAVLRVAGADKRPITTSTVAFGIAPRMNAAGRLGSAETSVELLLTDDPVRAEEIAADLDRENKERQATEQRILEEALAQIENDPNFNEKPVIVLASEGWHQGVIGIVASRICEKYYKPCILISCENGNGKGSGRSIPAFNLFEALTACEEFMSNFGGHAVAAGLNIDTERIPEFEKKINEYAKEILKPEDMVPQLSIDCELPPALMTVENAKQLSKFEPFGMGNETPVFSAHNMEIINIAQIGIDQKHLRLRLRAGGQMYQAVGFHMGEYYQFFREGSRVDAAFRLEVNNYQNNETVQLNLRDLRNTEATQEAR